MDTLVRLGRAGGHGDGERWRRQRSGALGEERTREEGEREGGEKDRGGCVATFRTSRRRGGGQAGRCRGGTTVRTRRPHAPGLLAGGGGRLALASRLGRPAGPHSARPQVSTGRLFFVILFSFLLFWHLFGLIKILNHFIFLCQYWQGLVVLFQSSTTTSIILDNIIYIYI